jgi:phage tail-like protein
MPDESATDRMFSVFNFEVILDVEDEETRYRAAFSEVSGLEINLEAIEVREGGYNAGVRRLVGKTSHPELVLKRGLTIHRGFWAWVDACMGSGAAIASSEPKPPRRGSIPTMDGEIVVHNGSRDGEDRLRFRFYGGMPTKVRMSDLKALAGGEVAIEELHIAHEGLERLS